MELARAFPMCAVQVYRDVSKQYVDLYRVIGVATGAVTVEAFPSGLRYPPPGVGELVHLESILPEAIHRVRARVVEVLQGAAVCLTLRPNGEHECIPRRDRAAIRVRIRVPARVFPRDGDESAGLKLKTRDVSIRGLRAHSPLALHENAKVKVRLHFGSEMGDFFCRGRVVRCWPRPDGRFDLRVAFRHLTPGETCDLVRLMTSLVRRQQPVALADAV